MLDAGGLAAISAVIERFPQPHISRYACSALADYSSLGPANASAALGTGEVTPIIAMLVKFGKDRGAKGLLNRAAAVLDSVFVTPSERILERSSVASSSAAAAGASTSTSKSSAETPTSTTSTTITSAATAATSISPHPSVDVRLLPLVAPAASALLTTAYFRVATSETRSLCCRILCRLVQYYPGGVAAVLAESSSVHRLVKVASRSNGMEGRALIRALLLIDAPTSAAVRSALLSAGVVKALRGACKKVQRVSKEGNCLQNTLRVLGFAVKDRRRDVSSAVGAEPRIGAEG